MAFSAVVCGPEGASSVTYVTSSGQDVACGTDSSGNPLLLQVAAVASGDDSPVDGGVGVGLELGGAVLMVMAVAWGVRMVGRFVESSGES
ncbi:hypothetical protein [Paraburkholderia sp. BCC1885]|uniref:hypothetical protein n=1 Tax=Paraburkholderia sp. BCC1885 TaxID=2562669 RepID=UPI0011836999|nr:hypothetical protein [Paraburkholderia sp. BCC1885]